MPKTSNCRSLLAMLPLAGIFACSHAAPVGGALPPAPNHFPASCVVEGTGGGTRHDSIRVVGGGPVSIEDAPIPRSDAERVAFGLSYETLVSTDCRGTLVPGLARTWSREGDDWRFVLREDAHFWDGAPVLAADVIAAWKAHDSTLATVATVDGAGVVRVSAADALARVTRPPAAVTKPAPDRGWPIGTGSRWITGAFGGGDADAVVQPTTAGSAPDVQFVRGSDDARDALESHADVVITADRAALAYAATRPRLAILPLAWSAEYVVVAPDPLTVDRGDLVSAVRVDAAPADDGVCPATRSRGARLSGSRRIAYRQGDPAGEALAARLIGSGALGRGVFAAALGAQDFERALDDGSEWAVLARRPAGTPCGESWGAATPLIAVRSSAVVDRSFLPVRLGPDGAPRLGEPR